jgi:hypothetical protein
MMTKTKMQFNKNINIKTIIRYLFLFIGLSASIILIPSCSNEKINDKTMKIVKFTSGSPIFIEYSKNIIDINCVWSNDVQHIAYSFWENFLSISPDRSGWSLYITTYSNNSGCRTIVYYDRDLGYWWYKY